MGAAVLRRWWTRLRALPPAWPRRLAVGGATALIMVTPASPSFARALSPARRDPLPGHTPTSVAAQLAGQQPLDLTPASSAPAPAPPALAAGQPLRPHELFGFAPYWTLDQQGTFDYQALTTVAYFGVDVAGDGTLQRSGDGWSGFESQQLVSLISSAHAQGDRVVLTAKCFDAGDLHALAGDPGAAGRLAGELGAAIREKNLDGANLDFEGTGGADRPGMAAFLAGVARALHAQDPHWQVTVDTYANSAANQDGFFDVPTIAPAVDAIFVMAYDMYQDGAASPNAPLRGYTPSDEEAVRAYVGVMPAEKVLLGVPFYGYDWATADNHPNDPVSSPPTPVTYAKVASDGHPVYWDSQGQVPWTAYTDGGQWHETYYDDPTSLALKAQLANRYRLLGLGIWALGMDGGSRAMINALLGGARPVKAEMSGPNGAPAAPAAPPPAAPGPAAPAPAAPAPRPKASPSPSPRPSPSPSPGGPAPAPSPPILPLPSPPL